MHTSTSSAPSTANTTAGAPVTPTAGIHLKPVFTYDPSDLGGAVSYSTQMLRDKDKAFVQGGRVVKILDVIVDVQAGQPITNVQICEVNVAGARDLLSQVITFKQPDAKKGERTKSGKTAPPAVVAEALLNRKGEELNLLTRVSNTPLIRADGSLIEADGYDHATGIFVRNGMAFPPIPAEPSRKDALAALQILMSPFREYPFVEQVDHTVVAAAILASILSSTLPAKPAIGVSANAPATGKSKLVDAIAMIATGSAIPMITVGKTETETEKRVDGLLIEGNPLIGIDNVVGVIGDAKMCAVLTNPLVKVRALGTSTMVTVRAPQLFLNGNNLTPNGDLCRRMLMVELNAGVANPGARNFTFDPVEEAAKNRAALVVAAITILRAYHVAGQPDVGLNPLGSYVDWSRRVRDALVWLGQPDVASTINKVRSNDPERRALEALIRGWSSVVGTAPVRAADLISQVSSSPAPKAIEMHDVLISVAGSHDGSICTKRLGTYLGKVSKRIIDGSWIEASTPP